MRIKSAFNRQAACLRVRDQRRRAETRMRTLGVRLHPIDPGENRALASNAQESSFSDVAARPLHFRSCPNNGHTKSQPFAAQRPNEFSKLDGFLRASAIDSETPT